MSTTFMLVEAGQTTFEITEASAEFDLTIQFHNRRGSVICEIEDLSADQTIDAALKMLNVVLYSYPEKMPEIVKKLQELRY